MVGARLVMVGLALLAQGVASSATTRIHGLAKGQPNGAKKVVSISDKAQRLIADEKAILQKKGIHTVIEVHGENQIVLFEDGGLSLIEHARVWSYPKDEVAIMRWQGTEGTLSIEQENLPPLLYTLLDSPPAWSAGERNRNWLMVDEFGDRVIADPTDPMSMEDYRDGPDDMGAFRLISEKSGNVLVSKSNPEVRSVTFQGPPISIGPNVVVHANEGNRGYLFTKLDLNKVFTFSGTLQGDPLNWIVPGQPKNDKSEGDKSLVRRRDLVSSSRFSEPLESYGRLYLATNANGEKFFIDSDDPSFETEVMKIVGKPKDLGAAVLVYDGGRYTLVPKSNLFDQKVSSRKPEEFDDSWYWHKGGWRSVGRLVEKAGDGITPAFTGAPESYGKSWLLEMHDSKEKRFSLKTAVATLSIPFVKIIEGKSDAKKPSQDPWVLVEQADGNRIWISTDDLSTRLR